jgi:hypothetical protein
VRCVESSAMLGSNMDEPRIREEAKPTGNLTFVIGGCYRVGLKGGCIGCVRDWVVQDSDKQCRQAGRCKTTGKHRQKAAQRNKAPKTPSRPIINQTHHGPQYWSHQIPPPPPPPPKPRGSPPYPTHRHRRPEDHDEQRRRCAALLRSCCGRRHGWGWGAHRGAARVDRPPTAAAWQAAPHSRQ